MTTSEGQQRPIKPVYLSRTLTAGAELSAGRLYDGSAHAENASPVVVALVFIGGAAMLFTEDESGQLTRLRIPGPGFLRLTDDAAGRLARSRRQPPVPAGCPATSPAGDSGQRGEAGELAAWAAGLGLEAGDLDDLVHDAYSRQASETNNDGLGSQVKFLIESYGTEGARTLLSGLLPQTERARLRRRAGQRPPPALRG